MRRFGVASYREDMDNPPTPTAGTDPVRDGVLWTSRFDELPLLTVIRGETGSGKSTVLARVADRAALAGVPVAIAAAFDDLRMEGAGHPLLILLDDLDHLEESAQQNLVARARMAIAGHLLARVVATATRATAVDAEACIVTLEPVGDETAARIARRRARHASPLVVDRVVALAHGNPAMLEAAAAEVDDLGLLGGEALPLPGRYRDLARQVREAPRDVHGVLADLAVRADGVPALSTKDDAGIPPEFRRAVGSYRWRAASSVHASAIQEALGPEEIRRAHARAAEDADIPAHERTRHAALADPTGRLLADWARTEDALAISQRIAALLEAARRAASDDTSAEWCAAAVRDAALAGDVTLAETLLTSGRFEVRRHPEARTGVALVRLLGYGDPRAARELVAEEPRREMPSIPAVRSLMAWLDGAVATDHDGSVKSGLEHQLLTAFAAMSEPDGAWRPELSSSQLPPTSLLARTVTDVDRATRLLRDGRWSDAVAVVEKAGPRAHAAGMRALARACEAVAALALAHSGDWKIAEERASAVLGDVVARDLSSVVHTARHALMHIAVTKGDADSAMSHLAAAERSAVDRAVYPTGWWIDMADTLELASAEDGPGPWPRTAPGFAMSDADGRFGLEYLSRRVDGDTSEGLRALVSEHRGRVAPFELGRALLRLGSDLRRAGRSEEARRLFTEAESEFAIMRMSAWVARARALRTQPGVESSQPEEPGIRIPLTEQEERIAGLAATGLSNKEIGRRLYLSPRTVGGHLYNVFPKLGITSRAALRDALTRYGGGERQSTLASHVS